MRLHSLSPVALPVALPKTFAVAGDWQMMLRKSRRYAGFFLFYPLFKFGDWLEARDRFSDR